MLVIVHHRDVQLLHQPALDLEALRSGDVLQVDSTEGGRDSLHRLDERVNILCIELDVEHIDVGERLEQQSLPLHHRLAGQRPDVPEAEHGGTIRDDGYEVSLGGVLVGVLRPFLDLQTGVRDPRGVSEREVPLGGVRFGRYRAHLPRRLGCVVGE